MENDMQASGCLADLIIAFSSLKPRTDEFRRLIATLFGYKYNNTAVNVPDYPTSSGRKTEDLGDSSLESETSTEQDGAFADFDQFRTTASEGMRQYTQTETWNMESLSRRVVDEMDLGNINPVGAAIANNNSLQLPSERLLREKWFNGIMSSLLATEDVSSYVDTREIERHVNSGRPFREIPFLKRRSLRRGVHLIFDYSESMQPFIGDQRHLLDRLRHYLGSSQVSFSAFHFDPWRPEKYCLSWPMPHPKSATSQRPVLFVSDFGVATGSYNDYFFRCSDVRKIINTARLNYCPILALVPITRCYWPDYLSCIFDFICEWDRGAAMLRGRRVRARAD